MPLNVTGLRPLDTSELKPLDTGGLTSLDVGGLTPIEKAGWGDTLTDLGKSIWDASVYHAPAAVAAAIEGDEPFATDDWKDSLINRARTRAEERRFESPAIQALGPSLGFSLVAAGSGLATGVPTGIAASAVGTPVAGTLAGYSAGAAASGTTAYRMATNQFVRDLYDSANAESKFTNGRELTREEFQQKQEQLAEVIRSYGLWEAVPEAAANVIGFGILSAPVKGAIGSIFGKNVLTRVATKLGALYGEELATETVTQMGQQRAEVEAGVSPALPREFTSPGDWAESFGEIAGPVLLQTTLMAGLGAGGIKTYERLRGERPGEVVEAKTADDISAFIDERQRELNIKADQVELTDLERIELDFLCDNRSNPEVVAKAYGVQLQPVGERERTRVETPPLSQDDIESPLPNDLIQEGREVLQDALGSVSAAQILSEAGFAPIGSTVQVSGRNATVVDAYEQDGVLGVKLRYQDGRLIAESFVSLRGRVSPVEETSETETQEADTETSPAAEVLTTGTLQADDIADALSNNEGATRTGIRSIQLDAIDDSHDAPNQARVEKLADEIRESSRIDPIVVVDEGGNYSISEGAHRYAAMPLLNQVSIPAEVLQRPDPNLEVLTPPQEAQEAARPAEPEALTPALDTEGLTPVETPPVSTRDVLAGPELLGDTRLALSTANQIAETADSAALSKQFGTTDLQSFAIRLGIDKSGSKREIAARVRQAVVDEIGQDSPEAADTEAIAAPQGEAVELSPETMLEIGVERAMNSVANAAKRREAFRQPMSDTELREFIGKELGSMGGSSIEGGLVDYKGGKTPSIRVRHGQRGQGYETDQTLKGKKLVEYIRNHYTVPQTESEIPPETGPPTTEPVAAPTETRIEDFGEKIDGARKDVWGLFGDTIESELPEDLKKITLSKHWPEPNYVKLAEESVDVQALALIKAMRDQVPNKPRVAWRLTRWAEQLKILRDFAADIIADRFDVQTVAERLDGNRSLRGVNDLMKLYVEVGFPHTTTNLKGWRIRSHQYSVLNGERFDKPVEKWTIERPAKRTAMSNWPETRGYYDTRDGALDAFKAMLVREKELPSTSREVQLDIYRVTATGKYVIGKKVAARKYIDLKNFKSVKEARAYLKEHLDELLALLEKKKKIPPVRRSVNDPRIGTDYRKGKDVTPEMFQDTFGFRGVEFGNWVDQKKRQNDLNNAYDGLMDLANVLGVPPMALALNGQLALAFGARGKGGAGAASAHYESGKAVINLTKKSGAGSLAHEWWHALDNYFGKTRGGADYVTEVPFVRKTRNEAGELVEDDAVRPEVLQAYQDLVVAVEKSGMMQRSTELDKRRTKRYWNTVIEMTARAFENYVVNKVAESEQRSDYLANIVSNEAFAEPEVYPYPTDEEAAEFKSFYDKIFETLETRTTDEGVELFALKPDFIGKADALEADLKTRLEQVGITDRVGVKLVDVIRRSSDEGVMVGAEGRYFGRTIEVAANARDRMWVMDHEVIHALRDLGVIRTAEWRALSRAATERMDGARDRYSGRGLSEEQLIEEAIADLHADWAVGQRQAKGFLRTAFERIRDFMEALGNALRGAGFQSAGDVFRSIARGEVGERVSRPGEAPREAATVRDQPARRQFGIPPEADPPISSHASDQAINAHDDYTAAKGGDQKAAERFVVDTVDPETVEEARRRFGDDVIYTPVVAMEVSGENAIPWTLAAYYAEATGADISVDIQQVSTAFHTGAKPLERIINRPIFDGPVETGRRYVLVDDVTVMGGTLAELADHIRSNGGEIAGIVTLVNASRGGIFAPRPFHFRLLEQRLGDEIRNLGINPKALTGSESDYLVGFKDVEQLRKAVAKAESDRRRRLRAKGVLPPETDEGRLALRPGDFDPERARRAVAFDNAESEARWQEARKGVRGQETMVNRVSDYIKRIASGFARHFIHLPNTAKFSPAREQLRKIEAAPQAAKEEALRTLRNIVNGMNRKQLDLFTRKVVLDDLSFEADNQHELPFGMTPADVKRELAKVNAALAPELQERVQLRNRLVTRVADDMVRSGVLTREQIKNPAYYRHQVLDYARAQVLRAKTPGKKLQSPHWARRMGSSLDINANLLEAEFEWLQKALTDIAVAGSIEWIKQSDYNVRDSVTAKARDHNKKLVDTILANDIRDNGFTNGTGRQTSPISEEWMKFKQRIAFGLSQVRDALATGNVTDIPSEFQATAEALQYEEDGEASIFPFLSWLIDNEKPGSAGAAMTFKAISQRKNWMRTRLGKQYADPMNIEDLVIRGFAGEGHKTWQPDDGRLLFTAKTIPEHANDRMLDRIAEDSAGPITSDEMRAALGSVRSLLAVGGPKYQMVLPEELVDTLNSLRDEDADSLIEAVFAVPLRFWKRWVLINPRRVLKYNLNNLSGDADAVIAGNPRALKKMPQSIRELWQVMIKGKTPSKRYREAVERGVFDSGLTIQEIPDINYLGEFESLIDPPSPLRHPARFAGSKLMKIWRALQRYTWFRENWLRYAAYLDYVERLEAGESMKSIGYGAGRRDMVDAIEDPKDRAALLARELVGDYGAVSHYGQGIRRKVIPFFSWLEINTKRYWRLNANAWDQGLVQGFKTTGVTGATLGLRTTAYLYLRMAMLYGMVQIWNNMVMGDEEEELSVEERARLHLILGRTDDGEIRTLRFQGALSDFMAWVGFEDAVATHAEIERGRASYVDLAKTIAKAPFNKVLNGLTPLLSAPIEYLSGKKFWPDVFRPRPIRDKARNIMQLFSIENEYDVIFDRPSRGYTRSVEQTVVYKRDVDENAYNRIKGMSYEWLRREKGLEGSGGYSTPRSQALYEWRLAKKFGDKKAESRAYSKLRDLGVSGLDLRASVRRAHPLGSVAVRDRGTFLKTLTAKERTMLKKAITWYEETYL